MYGFNKKELEGLDSNNPCSKNVYFKQWNNSGSICLCFRIMLSGLTVPDGLFMSYEWKEMSVSSPKLEFPSLRHFWHENNEDAEMKVTYRTFIRFHTRCTKNKPDRVSQEIAARKRQKKGIWWISTAAAGTHRGEQSYLPLHRVSREERCPEGVTVPQDHTFGFIPCSVLQGSAQSQSSAGVGERGVLFQPKLSYKDLSETEKCPFVANPLDISGLCFPPHQDKRNVCFTFSQNGRGSNKEIQFGKVKTQQMSNALFDIFSWRAMFRHAWNQNLSIWVAERFCCESCQHSTLFSHSSTWSCGNCS